MKCSACQQDNPPGARFCGECATPLASVCAECGAANPVGNKFCGQCAASLRVAPPPILRPQHLHAQASGREDPDLAGSPPGRAQDGHRSLRRPQGVHGAPPRPRSGGDARAARPVLELMMEAVHRYEGTVNQVMGDGIMALFGAPSLTRITRCGPPTPLSACTRRWGNTRRSCGGCTARTCRFAWA